MPDTLILTFSVLELSIFSIESSRIETSRNRWSRLQARYYNLTIYSSQSLEYAAKFPPNSSTDKGCDKVCSKCWKKNNNNHLYRMITNAYSM